MNKKTKYAINGAVWLGLGNGAINVINQLNDKPGEKFNWRDFFIAIGKGAMVGGVGGFSIGAYVDYKNGLEKPINTDAILFELVNKVKLNTSSVVYVELCQKADWLVNALKSEFSEKLKSEPFRFGSTEKGTALKGSSDIDICLSFKPKSFSSTEEMSLAVFTFLKKYIGVNSIISVRHQSKSIGVICSIHGKECKIDFLPKKITNSRGNKSSGYLFVNGDGVFDKKSYTKTNVHLLNDIKLSETQKNILLILKNWKVKEGLPIKSHLLQSLILDCYECNKGQIPRQFTHKIILVLKHIAKYLDTATIRSVENTNNVLTDIPNSDKSTIIAACKRIIEEYEYQPNSIIGSLKK